MSMNKTLFGIFCGQIGVLITLILAADGFYGNADAICHWLISKDAFERPILFLDQWNKPLFTVLSAPFAQFGLMGMRVFSGLAALATAVIISRIKSSDHGLNMLSGVLLLLIPQFLLLSTSSMTEPLFGLFFGLILFLIYRESWHWAAVIAGLIPFVRQEGMLVLLVVLGVLVLMRKPKAIILLFSGTIVFTLIGAVATGDPLWIITSFPYSSGSAAIYGSGSLWHYLAYTEETFGYPIAVAAMIGIILFLVRSVKRIPADSSQLKGESLALWTAVLVVAGFFAAHSIAWWKGMSGSLGLIRVMACIAPGVALLGAFAINEFSAGVKTRSWLVNTLVILFIGASTYQLILVTNLPTKLSETEKAIEEAALWFKDNPTHERVHYADPTFYYFANEFLDLESPINKGPFTIAQIAGFKPGERILWDAQFSRNEGRLPLDSLLLHPKLRLQNTIFPHFPVMLYDGKQYSINIFQVSETHAEKHIAEVTRVLQDFGNEVGADPIVNGIGMDGSPCSVAQPEHQYVTIRDTLTRMNTLRSLGMKAYADIYLDSSTEPIDFSFIASITSGEKVWLYEERRSDQLAEIGFEKWTSIELGFKLPKDIPDGIELRVYVWNRSNSTIRVDNLALTSSELLLKE